MKNDFSLFKDYFIISIPNIFTPNGDGINDEFRLTVNAAISECFSITIFDRWGLQLFSSTDADFIWSGEAGPGSKPVAGTYFYVININTVEYKGYISLIN